MAKGKGKKKGFLIVRTIDEETKEEKITVTDMEEEEEKVIDVTMDAAEYKEVMDMCKDMGYESIKDMAAALKEVKDQEKENEDPEKKKTGDQAFDPKVLSGLEEQIAKIKDVKVKDAAVQELSKFKDAIKGYTIDEQGNVINSLVTVEKKKTNDGDPNIQSMSMSDYMKIKNK